MIPESRGRQGARSPVNNLHKSPRAPGRLSKTSSLVAQEVGYFTKSLSTAHCKSLGLPLLNCSAASFMQHMQHLVTNGSALFSCLIVAMPDLAS